MIEAPHKPTADELSEMFKMEYTETAPPLKAPRDFADRAADQLVDSARLPSYALATIAAALRKQYATGYAVGYAARGSDAQ